MGPFDFFKNSLPKSTIDLSDFKFISNDHIRYQGGKDVSGHNLDAWRGIRVQTNIQGGEGYTVTIYNLDGNHPVWGNNVQMAPKQMKIIEQSNSIIKLRGFGSDAMGSSFADYGLTLYLTSNLVDKITLHMHDRNIDIVYFKASSSQATSPSQTTKTTNNMQQSQQAFIQGMQAFTSNNFERAVQNFTVALNASSSASGNDHFEACYFNRGQAYKALGEMAEAVADFKKAIELNPNKVSSYLKLAECLFEVGEYGEPHEAAEVLEECTKHFPNNQEAFMNLGIAYIKSVQNDKARQAFIIAQKLGNPDAERFIREWC